jgi:DNA-binding SARP family transcriptional activator
MLRLRLLGSPSILDDDRAIHLPSQKAQALLFYLAAEAERSFSRSQIIALLWEESTEREGRNSLSTVLTRLRQALPIVPLRAEGDTLAWQPSSAVWVDVHEFQALSHAPHLTQTDPPLPIDMLIQRLEAAATLYRGTFLDGFGVRDSEGYEEWLRLERERWQQRWLNGLEQLIDAYMVTGEWATAIGHARSALVADPLQERFHRALMRLHYYAGDRAAGLAQFRICCDVLERELGVEPDVETTALYQGIIEGRIERPASPTRPPIRPLATLPGAPRLSARLTSARRRSFVGRTDELALFSAALAQPEPPFAMLYIYGPGGVGKSTLLSEFTRICTEAEVPPLLLDGRNIQPTHDGFLNALREQTGADDPLAALPDRLALLIDTYELLTPLDSWLREHVLPQLPDRALVVLASRSPPASGWRVDPGWQEVTRVLQLDNLNPPEAREYLQRRNVPAERCEGVLRFTRGYPLALSLAAEVLLQRPGASFEGPPPPDVVQVLLERFIASVPSVAHRAALEACSQVRVMTEPLLAAMLDMPNAHELFEWLRDLSFISSGPRGLFPHDLAREALAADLKWRNPPWHLELHRRARTFYLAEFEHTIGHAQYVTLLDLIFLHDTPLIRSIFTWNEIGGLMEDAPREYDWPVLVEMVRRHEGEESAQIAARWFADQPESVTVYRDGTGAVTGFSIFAALRDQERGFHDTDPCVAAIQRYLATQPPLEEGQFAAINRFWMDRDSYQAVSPTQGMIFVASTRYVLTTPGLAYSFHVVAEPELWRPALEQVLIQRLPEADFPVGQRRYGVFMHDWHAQPPEAWLAVLAEHETEG